MSLLRDTIKRDVLCPNAPPRVSETLKLVYVARMYRTVRRYVSEDY